MMAKEIFERALRDLTDQADVLPGNLYYIGKDGRDYKSYGSLKRANDGWMRRTNAPKPHKPY